MTIKIQETQEEKELNKLKQLIQEKEKEILSLKLRIKELENTKDRSK